MQTEHKKSVWGSGSKPKGETLGDSSQTHVQATLIIGKCQLKFGEKHVDIGLGWVGRRRRSRLCAGHCQQPDVAGGADQSGGCVAIRVNARRLLPRRREESDRSQTASYKKNVWAFLILPPLGVFINRRVEYLWTTSIPKTSSSAA